MSQHLDYEINKELGECYLFMGDLDKAENYYRKAANSAGEYADSYLGLATIAVQRGQPLGIGRVQHDLAAFDRMGALLAQYCLADRRGMVMAARAMLRDRLARIASQSRF